MIDKTNITRQVTFIPSEFSNVGLGDKPGAVYYMNAYTEEVILEQLILEVNSEEHNVRPSYAYFLCNRDYSVSFYIGSSVYRSVFNPIDKRLNQTVDLNIPVRFANPLEQ